MVRDPSRRFLWLVLYVSSCFNPDAVDPAVSESFGGTSPTDAGPTEETETSSGGRTSIDAGPSSSDGTESGLPTAEASTRASESEGSATEGPDLPPLLACVETRVSAGAEIVGSTLDAPDDFTLTCGAGTGNDLAYEWIVPRTDYYRLTTEGSSLDSVLGVLDADCATELSCSNNVGNGLQSEIVRRFEGDDRVVLVVDGNLGDRGDFAFQIDAVVCPELDLTGQPLPAELSTIGGVNEREGRCGGAGNPERTVRWLAPTAGLYRFSVESDAFDPAIHLETGAQCGGTLVGCGTGNGSYPAEVTRYLEANEPVSLTIDSTNGEGTFSLDIAASADACPSQSDELGGPQTLEANTSSHILSASCSPTGSTGFGGPGPFVDDSYPLNIDLCPTCACVYSITSDAPLTVYVLRGTHCEGEEVECVPSTGSGSEYEAEIRFSPADNGDYVLVVESRNLDFSVNYDLLVQCVA